MGTGPLCSEKDENRPREGFSGGQSDLPAGTGQTLPGADGEVITPPGGPLRDCQPSQWNLGRLWLDQVLSGRRVHPEGTRCSQSQELRPPLEGPVAHLS